MWARAGFVGHKLPRGSAFSIHLKCDLGFSTVRRASVQSPFRARADSEFFHGRFLQTKLSSPAERSEGMATQVVSTRAISQMKHELHLRNRLG
jgi:hypothetical protein